MIKAELIDFMGDDLRVANAARVSFDKESEWEWVADPARPNLTFPMKRGEVQRGDGKFRSLSERDTKLIHFLARENHFTPFTHCIVTLRETVPIFVARQRFKHVVGFTYNEVSRRYVDSEPEFYVPETWRKRADNKKQGSSEETETFLRNPFGVVSGEIAPECAKVMREVRYLYDRLIMSGVCPEQARMVLPQSMMTSYYVTGSLAAFARAYSLRTDPHAQKEIQDLAVQWDEVIRPLFPVSWEALTNG
jgi:thymidylate synthase (FAD)